jgi:subtilisin family serine protease
MSWAFNADRLAEKLLQCGAETDPARAATRGAAIYATLRPALERVMRDSPDILFVAGAGNSDQPAEVARYIPQTLGVPNLLVVGGTGSGGRPTGFTTFGEGVAIYGPAEGIAVRGLGGLRMRSSGTSFSGPYVARIAASMLAVAPGLKPAALVAGLKETATAGEGGIRLADAGAAVRWAAARR